MNLIIFQRGDTNALLSLVFPLVFLLEAIILYSIARFGYDPLFVRIVYSSAITILLLQTARLVHKCKETGWIQIDILFLLMFFFIHFWPWLGIDIGIFIPNQFFQPYFDSVDKAIAIAFLGMTAFVFVFNLAETNYAYRLPTVDDAQQWRSVGLTLFYIGVLAWLLYMALYGQELFHGNYAETNMGGLAAKRLYLIHSILVKMGFITLLVSTPMQSQLKPTSILTYIFMALILSSYLIQGDRSEFILSLAMILFAYSRHIKPIRLAPVVIVFFAVAILMSAVQIARRSDTRSLEKIYETIVTNTDGEVSAIKSLNTLGKSGFIHLAAVHKIPNEIPHSWGQLKMLELAGTVPLLRQLLPDSLGGKYKTTTNFLTAIIYGENSNPGQSGTTIVADLYIDFGILGVIAGMAFLGYLSAFINGRALGSRKIIPAVLFCYFAGTLTILPRYSFLKIIRALIWPMVIMLLFDIKMKTPIKRILFKKP